MPTKTQLLTDAQWARIELLLVDVPGRRPPGRPRSDSRRVFEGILWVLKHQARWRDLPGSYPSPSTCWRHFKQWQESGVWLRLWRAFLKGLNGRQRADWGLLFIDAILPNGRDARPAHPISGAAGGRRRWWLPTAKVFLSEVAAPGGRAPPRSKRAATSPLPGGHAAKVAGRRRSKKA